MFGWYGRIASNQIRMNDIEINEKIGLKNGKSARSESQNGKSLVEEITQEVAEDYKNERITDPRKFTDKELYDKCQHYGANAKIWLRRFAGLLPEVHNRELYRIKGFLSIYEFAKKLAGMNEFTVGRILNLSARIEDKPNLRMQFESGEQGWSKIEKVAYIATPKTDAMWAKNVKKMSHKTLAEYIRGYKNISETSSIAGGESEGTFGISPEFKFLSFKVSKSVEHKLRVYKQALEKHQKMNLGWNEVFGELLDENDSYQYTGSKLLNEKIAQSKTQKSRSIKSESNKPIIKNQNKTSALKSANNITKKPMIISTTSPTHIPMSAPTRHIPVAAQREVYKKYKTKCAFPTCNRPFDQLHHRKRFSIFKDHNPGDIIPLCNTHHSLVHTGLIKNEKDLPEKWAVKEKEGNKMLSDLVDEKILKFRTSL